MVIRSPSPRRLTPGTTGWKIQDLDDPEIEQEWESTHFEIMEGVLTEMPPAYFDGAAALSRLCDLLREYFKKTGQVGSFGFEVDLILSSKRVLKPDAVYLSPDAKRLQKQANAERGKRDLVFGRLLIPPPLVIESISLGHEARDAVRKRAWYAEFGIPNYWLLNAHDRTLQCLLLEGDSYRVDQAGKQKDKLMPSAFRGLTINLADLWLD